MDKRKTIVSIIIGVIFLGIILTFYTTFSLEDGYLFESVVYQIGDGKIEGISPYTDIRLFYDYFDLENCNIKVVNEKNEEVTSGYIVNGSTTVLSDYNHKVIATYQNIVIGDSDQNGIVDASDLEKIARGLIDSSLDTSWIVSLDVNQDEEFRMNDLILLDKAINMDYQELTLEKTSLVLQSNELGRVGYSVKPEYGKNSNLKWSSSHHDIVIVRESGAMVGHAEGNAIVRAETMDGKLFQEIQVKVDNTIQLESYEGIIYVGGSEKRIFIKSIDYEGITCSSSNESAVSCSIDGKYLVLRGNGDGKSVVTVSSPLYGSVEYSAQAYSTYINLFPSYGCSPIHRTGAVTISSFFAGDLSFEISDPDLIKDAYVSENKFIITAGSKAGRGEVVVRESNGNSSKKFVLDVYNLSIPVIGGFGTIGVEMEADIVAEGTETLTCESPNPEIATCRIEGKKLYVMPLKNGQVEIRVKNTIMYGGSSNACGETTFLAVIREEGS